MSPLFKKLNLKDQHKIAVFNAPNGFECELTALPNITIMCDPNVCESAPFVLAFVTTPNEVESIANWVTQHTNGDAVIWFAYPKSTSKTYQCGFNRDTGWGALGQAGFEPVRQVAIDADWSALRFRRVAFIKTMRRSEAMAISQAGKARVKA